MRQVTRRYIRLAYDSTMCYVVLYASTSSYPCAERERESLHGFISIRRGCLGRRENEKRTVA
jgi:hypothetical protein